MTATRAFLLRRFNGSEHYLGARETRFYREMRAYVRLENSLKQKDPVKARESLKRLQELQRGRHGSYCELERALAELELEGTVPAREKCLDPVAWLYAKPSRIQALFERATERARRARVRLVDRELKSQCELEREVAADGARAIGERFQNEFPTELEQRAAIARLHSQFPERFFGAEPASEIGFRVGVLLWAEILSLASQGENVVPLRGTPQPARDRVSKTIVGRKKIA